MDGNDLDAASEPGASLTRHEQELHVGTSSETVGSVVVHKTVESEPVSDLVDRDVEEADAIRVPPDDQDSGEIVTLPDGSVSVPVFEEELVVTKRLVVRERIVIQKRRVTEVERVEGDLLRERIEVEGDTEPPRRR
jgi:stress response protein YsnF